MGFARAQPILLPDGQISKNLSSPVCKNISVFPKCKSGYMICRPVPLEGRFAIVTDAGRDAVDADAPITNGAEADGGGVWSGRPDAGVKFSRSKLLGGDGGKKARSPGRARRKPLKPLRGECWV